MSAGLLWELLCATASLREGESLKQQSHGDSMGRLGVEQLEQWCLVNSPEVETKKAQCTEQGGGLTRAVE